ncbi:MAG: methyl-accepting chemotaxis protein [Lachnospiraceae bacterium]|nr:methyl-accepting chemotaxis protein [Lachnospiraceae bacterium]
MAKVENSSSNAQLKGPKSIKQTVAVLVGTFMVLIAIIGEIVALVIFSSSQEETMQLSMRAVSRAYSIMLNNTPEMEETEFRSFLASNLSGIKINDIDSSYIMVVNRDSIVEFHGGDSSRIGQQTINDVMLRITQEVRTGATAPGTGGYATYTVSGVEKFSSYYVTTDGRFVVCAVMDKKDVTADVVAHFLRMSILIYAGFLILFIVIAYVVVGKVVKPIGILKHFIDRVANFDLHYSEEGEAAAVMVRRDEFGQIGRELRTMMESLKEVVNRLDESSQDLNQKATHLHSSMEQVSENSSDNSATSEELAAGMEETTATTETIATSVTSVAETAKAIKDQTDEGVRTASDIQKKATQIAAEAEESGKKTQVIFENVRVKSEAAIESSKAVSKINELTENIKSIADQTNLLALNASIEAARAGESGKGFAVVAEEIGNLANQSGETVESISAIVGEVNVAVGNMSDCLSEMMDFIANTVSKDYVSFTSVSRQYNDDAIYFENSMKEITDAVNSLSDSMDSIREAIDGINTTINESAIGVTDVAQKTTDIVGLIGEANDIARDSKELANTLKGIVD